MSVVLIIEDNPANLELMHYLLDAFGHEVRSATDGMTGLTLIQHDPPAVIVCDIQIPHLDGLALARRLKADPALRHIPLIAVTAQAMVGDRERILEVGFDGYIPKPINPECFVQQVEAFLGQDSDR
ncbi:response regulator receiver protein [Oscillochloris trichoides DG-6]|uniref:Response regulator receiver protein n=1 Tax=Oscillochloris trichoides DG-6 TaxID=765420 RepID=E1ICY3_9CHLR|nr:response regulator [Oscillochloris trichoides]EFO80953.1 response regulator receiver protein [Oscillochloris trichoides DG-6]